ncbi:MAG: hypothetical protein IPL26_13470 [Leptospiraceae bacterium]|nr:hypothetical protein [Leptospiraceae bacterium]
MQHNYITGETLILGCFYFVRTGHLELDTNLLFKTKPAPIGTIHSWQDGKLHRKTADGWKEVVRQRKKTQRWKEYKSKSLFSKYDLQLIKEHPNFFRNSKVKRSFAKFREHLKTHPEYKKHLGRLSLLEAFSIYHYSLKWGVRPLNTDLEDNTLSLYTKEYEDILSKALSKLPSYPANKNPVYHGTTLRDRQIQDLKRKLVNNESFKFGFFTSVGLRVEDGEKYMTKNRGKIKADERLVMFVIAHKTAKNVTNLRWRTDTHEAIIGHDIEYEILDVQLMKGYIEIQVREL